MMSNQRWDRRIAGLGLVTLLAAAGGLVFAQSQSTTPPDTRTNGRTESRMNGSGTDSQMGSPTGAAKEPQSMQRADTAAAGGSVDTVIQDWPKDVKALAQVLIEKYGNPATADQYELVWINNGPWRKTSLHRDGFTHTMLGRTRDHLEQVISYRVPEDKVSDLQRFDKRVEVKQGTDELSSRADSESLNFLALNLADDIVKGQRTVKEARDFYSKVRKLEKTGKSSPYLDGLIFNAQEGGAKEPAGSVEPGSTESDTMDKESGGSKSYDDVHGR